MNDCQISEEELLERWRASASEEERRLLLEAALTPYLGRITRWALRICGSPDEAAETAQDALLAICSHIDQFRGECRFSTWVFAIVQNQARRRGMRSSRRRETSIDQLPEPTSPGPDAEDGLDQQLRMVQFRKLINTELTPLEAKIFLLHFGEEVPLAVLDRELRLTNRSGAKAHLVSATRKLRRKMKPLLARAPSRRAAGKNGLAITKGAEDE